MQRIHLVLVAAFALLTTVGCNREKMKQLEQQNLELSSQKRVQDSLINDFVTTFNTFEENLSTIKEKEGIVSLTSSDPEMAESKKDAILRDIQEINARLEQNRQIIDDLTRRAQSAEGKTTELNRLVARLRKQLEERDAEIASLRGQLQTMGFTVESLNTRLDSLSRVTADLSRTTEAQSAQIQQQSGQIQQQSQTIAQQDADLNSAYYVVGTVKDLKAAGVLSSAGAFKGKTVGTDFDDSQFTKIDLRNVTSIPVDAKKVELKTSHPSGTYTLMEEGKMVKSIEITDPARFWRNSKYLVVVLN
jgi:uncharacterized protein YoxC